VKHKFLVLACLVSAFALMIAGVAAQEQPPEQPEAPDPTPVQPDDEADGDVLALMIEETDGSGVDGFAVMWGERIDDIDQQNDMAQEEPADQNETATQETDVVVLIRSDNNEEPGAVVMLEGTCDDPGNVVERLGDLQALAGGYALRTAVDQSIQELQDADYVLAVLATDVNDNGEQNDQQEEVDPDDILACGALADAELLERENDEVEE
jgi:hypothetical protein